jgi:hypothetical protein
VTKKTFDLVIMIDVGVLIVWGGASIWSRRRLMSGPNSGVLYSLAKLTKAVTS